MKTIVILFLGSFLCITLAEPVRYRQTQQVQASARQIDQRLENSENEESQKDVRDSEGGESQSELTPESIGTVFLQPPSPYPPQGWRPFGQLLVLPVAVRTKVRKSDLESTTTVESSTFNDSETTEETPTSESQPEASLKSGEQQELETSEPKIKKTEAHKRPPTVIIIKGKKGELKLESKQDPKEESTEAETDFSTTENSDEATTTSNPRSENLESTPEPDAEAVDVEKSNEEGKKVNKNEQLPSPLPQAGFLIQLPDGTFQRIVYVAPQTSSDSVPQPPTSQIQQFTQAPNSPFGFNPITNPRIVTFSTQYNAW